MLRIKKPQPKFLSAVIRNKLNKRAKWVERQAEFRVALLFARDEDYWDRLTGATGGWPWAHEIYHTIRYYRQKLEDEDTKRSKTAEAMWQIVLRERELAAKEEKERETTERNQQSDEQRRLDPDE